MKIQSVRGTHDIYGENILKFNQIKSSVSCLAKTNGFKELNTPIFEFSNLFSKPLGEQSDVVLKEMYTFEDRNKEYLTLRPEYTTPMIRAAITNNLLNDLPLKVFGIGPMFRRERPQKGRYRQFNQINFEIFGSNDFIVDVELIVLADQLLKKILPNCKIKLNLNSLGSKNNLLDYKKVLSKYFNQKKNHLSEISISRIESNPLRILDSKEEADKSVCASAPIINEFLDEESRKHFDDIKKSLDYLNIDYVENNKLVRGLDYYCKTVFEFKTTDLGTQDTLLGGGRYDGLIEVLGGPKIPGIGWAAGIERISMLMDLLEENSNIIHIAVLSERHKHYFLKLTKYLREKELSFYWNYKYNIKKSLSKANSSKAKILIIVGEKEENNNFYTVKNLISSEQFELQLEQITEFLNDKF